MAGAADDTKKEETPMRVHRETLDTGEEGGDPEKCGLIGRREEFECLGY